LWVIKRIAECLQLVDQQHCYGLYETGRSRQIFHRSLTCRNRQWGDRRALSKRQINELISPFGGFATGIQKNQVVSTPSWGAPKIREKIRRKHSEIQLPAISTVHAILDRHGLVNRPRRKRYRAKGTALSHPLRPNDLWCADYKGEFMLGDKRYCYPLTTTDAASRYLLSCEALSSTQGTYAFTVFERVFKDFGLPQAIRTDNGVPFASPNSLFGLSKLSVWWLRLGIAIERIQPARPEQNGRHERMHLTLKKEATKPAANNLV
jgi:putative transposase